VLGRPGDAGGSASWIAALSAGTSRTAALQGFIGSSEHQAQLAAGQVDQLAESADGATVDGTTNLGVVSIAGNSSDYLIDATQSRGSLISLGDGTVNALTNVSTLIFTDKIVSVQSNGSTSSIDNSLSAAESQLSNTQYVEWLYATVLGRPGDAGGSASWIAALSAGTSRTAALQGFIGSSEHQAQLATGQVSQLAESADGAILSTVNNAVFDPGNGRVTGTSASETLFASSGSTLTGGGGADRFEIDRGLGKVIITDFSGKDTLDLNPFVQAGLSPIIALSGSNTVIGFGTGDSITLLGVTPDHLSQSGGSLSFH